MPAKQCEPDDIGSGNFVSPRALARASAEHAVSVLRFISS